MQKWEYTEKVQVRDPETGVYHWSDHRNHKMLAIRRLGMLSEHGWELAAAYPIGNGIKVFYLLKRPIE